MIMNTEEVPEDGLIAVLVTCKGCDGSPMLPSGQICQTCKGEGKLTTYVSVDAITRHVLLRLADMFENMGQD